MEDQLATISIESLPGIQILSPQYLRIRNAEGQEVQRFPIRGDGTLSLQVRSDNAYAR